MQSASRLRQALLAAVAGVPSAFALWWLVAWVIAADRGLDLTDEGLYLLDADPPSSTAAWLLPYGWHTGVLFRLVGYDIAAFRTIGAVLLVIAGATLGIVVARLGQQLRDVGEGFRDGDVGAVRPLSSARDSVIVSMPADRALYLGGALVGGVSVLMYYLGLLRAPSYNWLNLFGVLVAAIGFVAVVQRLDQPRSRRPDVQSGPSETRRGWPMWAHWSTATAGFGCFLTLPAKPISPALVAAVIVPPLLRVVGWRRTVGLVAQVAAWSFGWLGIAVLFRWWPAEFVEVFRQGLAAPELNERHNILGALWEFARTPLAALTDLLAAIPVALLAATAVSAGVVAARSSRHWGLMRRKRWQILSILAIAIVVLSFGEQYVTRWFEAGTSQLAEVLLFGRPVDEVSYYVGRLVRLLQWMGVWSVVVVALARWWPTPVNWRWILLASGSAAAAVGFRLVPEQWTHTRPMSFTEHSGYLSAGLVLCAAVVLATLSGTRASKRSIAGHPSGSVNRDPLLLVAMVAFLCALPVIANFGSDLTPYSKASTALVFVFAGMVLSVATWGSRRLAQGATAVITVLAVVVVANVLADGRADPYRMRAMASQTVEVEVGPHRSPLLLDPVRAEMLESMRGAATEHGWSAGDPLFGLAWRWSSTLPYHLGARVPESLMPTLFGNPGSLERLRFNLEWIDLEGWDQAWLMVPTERRMNELSDPDQIHTAITMFTDAVGTTFPDDYVLVWSARAEVSGNGQVELWRRQ